MAERFDIIIPITGTSDCCDVQDVKYFVDNEYEVNLLFIRVSKDHSERYSAERASHTGRPDNWSETTYNRTMEKNKILSGVINGINVAVSNEDFEWRRI